MRNKKGPVLTFGLPPNAPEPVAKVAAAFDEIATRYAALEGDLEDALQVVEAAKAQDAKIAGEAFAAGKKAPDPIDANERAALAPVAGIRAALEAAAPVVDKAGTALVRVVHPAREEWATTLQAKNDEARKEYAQAIAAAQKPLAVIAQTRGALAWLAQFDVGETLSGRGYPGGRPYQGGGRVRVEGPGRSPLGQEHDPVELLKVAAKAGEPEVQPQPRTHKVAKEAVGR